MTGNRNSPANVWELTLEQLDHLYQHRHVNNYVYAALQVMAARGWPRGPEMIQPPMGFSRPMTKMVAELLDFVPRLEAAGDTGAMRTAVSLALYRFYRTLPEAEEALTQLPRLMQLMAGLAFLPLVAEREDRFPLWWHRPVRPIEEERRRELAILLRPFDLEELLEFYGGRIGRYCDNPKRPISRLYSLTIRLVSTVIIMMENGLYPELAWRAFQHIESAMLDFEGRHRLGNLPGMVLNISDLNQIRYRNTLYLYGGNLLERMGRRLEAREWYLKDIHTPDLPGKLEFYLTAFKTCERLLCAYRTLDGEEHEELRKLLDQSMARSLSKTREYACKVLNIVKEHPRLDLSQPKLQIGDKQILFSGEASREPLLASLLYQHMVRGTPYLKTDYSLIGGGPVEKSGPG